MPLSIIILFQQKNLMLLCKPASQHTPFQPVNHTEPHHMVLFIPTHVPNSPTSPHATPLPAAQQLLHSHCLHRSQTLLHSLHTVLTTACNSSAHQWHHCNHPSTIIHQRETCAPFTSAKHVDIRQDVHCRLPAADAAHAQTDTPPTAT